MTLKLKAGPASPGSLTEGASGVAVGGQHRGGGGQPHHGSVKWAPLSTARRIGSGGEGGIAPYEDFDFRLTHRARSSLVSLVHVFVCCDLNTSVCSRPGIANPNLQKASSRPWIPCGARTETSSTRNETCVRSRLTRGSRRRQVRMSLLFSYRPTCALSFATVASRGCCLTRGEKKSESPLRRHRDRYPLRGVGWLGRFSPTRPIHILLQHKFLPSAEMKSLQLHDAEPFRACMVNAKAATYRLDWKRRW